MPVLDGVIFSLLHDDDAVLVPLQLPDAQQEVGLFVADQESLIDSPLVIEVLSTFKSVNGGYAAATGSIIFQSI